MRKLRSVIYGLAAGAPWLYLLVIRPWHVRWGTTTEEAQRDLPGDELVRHPGIEVTRAITIAAPPSQVWPWLVQMGRGRGGFYSYDRLDNQGKRSADRIIPELQQLAVGDTIPTGPDEGFTVAHLEPERALVLHDPRSTAGPVTAAMSWVLTIAPAGGHTRMVCRMRIDLETSLAARMYSPVLELIDFVMMRRQLLGIRERAERLAASAQPVPRGRPAAVAPAGR